MLLLGDCKLLDTHMNGSKSRNEKWTAEHAGLTYIP